MEESVDYPDSSSEYNGQAVNDSEINHSSSNLGDMSEDEIKLNFTQENTHISEPSSYGCVKAENSREPAPPISKQQRAGNQMHGIELEDKTDDLFDDRNERARYKRHTRALVLNAKLNGSDGMSAAAARAFVEQEINLIYKGWPALFGATPAKVYVHLDLDSFYASVETLVQPAYISKPMAVGSKSMLAAVNYPAREYGIKSGMPGYKAKQLCPWLAIQPCNFKLYNKYSEIVMGILSIYDPEIEIYGIDEACLVFDEAKLSRARAYFNAHVANNPTSAFQTADKSNGLGDVKVSGENLRIPLPRCEFSVQSVAALINKVRAIVHCSTGLTISAGLSVCRGLAKRASNVEKPNGQFLIEKDFDDYILPLSVDKLNGIGKATREMLYKTAGIESARDLRNRLEMCAMCFKQKTFTSLVRLSFGLSCFDRPNDLPNTSRAAVSHGMSITIHATTDTKNILHYLWNLSHEVSRKLARGSQGGTCLTLTIKFASFDTTSIRRNGLSPMVSNASIFENCIMLMDQRYKKNELKEWILDDSIRLLGVSVGDLIATGEINPLDKYAASSVPFKPRHCPVCKAPFVHESSAIFEIHTNNCLDRASKKQEASKSYSLMAYLKKDEK